MTGRLRAFMGLDQKASSSKQHQLPSNQHQLPSNQHQLPSNQHQLPSNPLQIEIRSDKPDTLQVPCTDSAGESGEESVTPTSRSELDFHVPAESPTTG